MAYTAAEADGRRSRTFLISSQDFLEFRRDPAHRNGHRQTGLLKGMAGLHAPSGKNGGILDYFSPSSRRRGVRAVSAWRRYHGPENAEQALRESEANMPPCSKCFRRHLPRNLDGKILDCNSAGARFSATRRTNSSLVPLRTWCRPT